MVHAEDQKQKGGRKMKFLTISSFKDTFFALPPATSRQIAEASLAYMNQQKQAGRILEMYVIPGWRRSVVISEAASAEDIVKSFTEMPGFGVMDFELYPLADFEETLKYSIEVLKRVEQTAR
jgi:muconolactone delta-isomerase